MIRKVFLNVLISAVLLALLVPQTQAVVGQSRIRFVTPNGSGDCTSWSNSCSLQAALTGAVVGDELWVAAGTYTPTTGADRTATFQLAYGVEVYGGFAGTETNRDERDPTTNLTVLSGDIDNNDSQQPVITDLKTVSGNQTNSYHVVTGASGSILDGFTITAGYSGGSYPDDTGAGLVNNSANPTLSNLIIIGNMAVHSGGGMRNESSNPNLSSVDFISNSAVMSGAGMYNLYSSPILSNVTFDNNWTDIEGGGGGMSNLSNSSPSLTAVIFNNNSAQSGGGMTNFDNSNPTLSEVLFSNNLAYNFGAGGGMNNDIASPILVNVTFFNNSAYMGGGMRNNYASVPSLTNVTFIGNNAVYGGGLENYESNPVLTNITFVNNTASWGGGIENENNSNPTLTNVTLTGNSASGVGGGMLTGLSSYPQIVNSIFWGNTAPVGAQVEDGENTVAISDSVVEGGFAGGTNIISADPLLGTLGDYGGFTQVIPILAGSSAIDTGNDVTCPLTDQRDVSRPQGLHCDIGAFESLEFATATPTTTLTPTSTSTHTVTPTNTITPTFTMTPRTAGIRFVTSNGIGDCTSWESACSLQTALTTSVYGDEMWVAAGIYTPAIGPDRTATFQLKSGVAVYGGFSGIEITRDQRDPDINLTVLSGDIDNNDSQKPVITNLRTASNINYNSYHVVTGATGSILDGFTITAGYAGGSYPDDTGAGLVNNSSNPTLSHLIFSGNRAINEGGGMSNVYSNPSLTDLEFMANSAPYGAGMSNFHSSPYLTRVNFNGNWGSGDTSMGGGLFNQDASSPTLTTVTFIDNTSYYGGGMVNLDSCDPVLTDVIFTSNSAYFGGGIYNGGSSNPELTNVTFNSNRATIGGGMENDLYCNPILTNVTFAGNLADYWGGGFSNDEGSAPTLTNVTFSGNSANSYGGGMSNWSGTPQIVNAIFWGNTAPNGSQIFDFYNPGIVSYSVVQGGYASGTNILTTDPLLGTLGDYGGFTQVIPILAGSSAIDTGNDVTCPLTDQRGVSRPQGLHCDIGAFESLEFATATPTTTLTPTSTSTHTVTPTNTITPTRTFTPTRIPQLDAPVLIYPINGVIVTSAQPKFDWGDVAGATNYEIQISTTSDFSTILINSSSIDSFFKYGQPLPRGIVLYWQVRAYGQIRPSEWSSSYFSIK